MMLAAFLAASQNEAGLIQAPSIVLFCGLGLVVVNPLICWLQFKLSGTQRKPDGFNVPTADDCLPAIERRQFCFWIASSWVFYLGCNWARGVYQMLETTELTIVGELMVIAPAFAALLANQYFLASSAPKRHFRKLFWFRIESQLRPFAAFFLLPLLFEASGQQIVKNWSSMTVVIQVLAASCVLTSFFCLPRIMLRIAFPTRPLKVELIRQLQSTFAKERSGFQVSFAEWDSKGNFCNALVLPTFRGRVRILFSDVLLEFFEPTELAAIARHELAHASQCHFLFRLAAILLPFGFLSVIDTSGILELISFRSWQSAPQITISGAFGILAASFFSVLLFRIVSFNNEFEADRVAVQVTPALNIVHIQRVDELLMALQKLACLFPNHVNKSCLTHPSLAERIERLEKMKRTSLAPQQVR